MSITVYDLPVALSGRGSVWLFLKEPASLRSQDCERGTPRACATPANKHPLSGALWRSAGKNAAVALRKDGAYAVWTTAEGLMAKAPGKPAYVVSKSGAFPVLTGQGAVIAAWEDNGVIHTRGLE